MKGKISVWAWTIVGQKLPENWKQKSKDFLNYIKKVTEEKKIQPKENNKHGWNFTYLDRDSNYTVDSWGIQSVSITTMEHEKLLSL